MPKRAGSKNCNKMKNRDQISTYVRQMTDDMLQSPANRL